MKLPRRTFPHLAASMAALPAVSRVASAQAYPSRPVRIVVTGISTSRPHSRPPGWSAGSIRVSLRQSASIDNDGM
jgi:hypothetical protein